MHDLFKFHRLNPEGVKKAAAIAESFDTLLMTLEPLCTDPRLKAIVRTKLEEACFFAKKAMAVDPTNQEQ